MKEQGTAPAGGSQQVAAALQTSTGIRLLLPLSISSSSRALPLAQAAGSCREQRQNGWCTPWRRICCAARHSHEWLLKFGGPQGQSSTPLSGGRHEAVQPGSSCFASASNGSRAAVVPKRCFPGTLYVQLLQSGPGVCGWASVAQAQVVTHHQTDQLAWSLLDRVPDTLWRPFRLSN